MNQWSIYLAALEADLACIIRHELEAAGARAVYVQSASECGIEFFTAPNGGVIGATSASMATWLRSNIGNRWRGNGPAMLINLEMCRELAGVYEPAQYSIAREVACHELTHIVLRPELFRRTKTSPLRRQFDRVVFTSGVEAPDTTTQRDDHGPEFVRIVLHIAERLRRLGRTVNHTHLLDWGTCCPARPMECERTLFPEIDGLIDLPLSEVAALAAPGAYLDLWNQHPSPTSAAV